MINVCTKYGDTIILLESFETKEEAEEFMKYDYVLNYADELENAEEDEIVHSDEMFLEDEIPFFEKQNIEQWTKKLDLDELPF